MNYSGLIAEVNAKATIPDKQLEAIMTAYPSCWGYAAPVVDKQGKKKLLTGAQRLPEGFSSKDINELKAQFDSMPEMVEYFGKMPENTDDICMQPFPLLENDGGGITLCLFMEGDFAHWANDETPNLSPEYICYRDKIAPLVLKLETQCQGNVSKIVKELGDPVYADILGDTYNERGVLMFLADTCASQTIEGGNEHRKDEDWGGISNEVPDIQINTDTTVEEEHVAEEPKVELSLAEKRRLRQQKKPDGVHTTTASPRPVTSQKDTTLSEQRIKEVASSQDVKDSLKGSTAPAKGPFLFTLPSTIRTADEAKAYWQTNFGTVPDNWKHKDDKGSWLPSYKAGLPYEKAAQKSVIREKYNPDGSSKSGAKGFAALDNIATNKGPEATAIGPHPDASRSASATSKIPVIPPSVRDKVVAEILKLDLKSRKIMSNDEVKAVEAKHSTLFSQLKNIPHEDMWKLSYEELHKLNTSYPDFGSVWLFSLRNYQQQNWKSAIEETHKEETGNKEPVQQEPVGELTLAQKRALRKQNKAA